MRDLYKDRGITEKETDEAVNYVLCFEKYLEERKLMPESACVDDMRAYIESLIESSENTLPRFLAIARYFYLIGNHDIYIYFTSLLGGLGVMENIKDRLERMEGGEVSQKVFEKVDTIPLGTEPIDMPPYTQAVMENLLNVLPPDRYKRVLAGNNHGIPRESMVEEKQHYEESESLDAYLVGRHARKVAELQEYCDSGQVWYEQVITQEVVDYVASNQEILSAVREGNTLYVTKIPYDAVSYLKENNGKMTSYYACHCPFARESILSSNVSVHSDWCYCSGGFAKFPFEVILDRELEVEMLQSALAGDDICRFAIKLPDDYKKR